ncbi:hypothetical protein H9Y04_26115 [Streptomyces sp. TRM66268-LWL]|uniref:Lipoprotein n=1 Tax=Streptomyces polyasparticus TaxID=2767826 RepID=A0ABR7SN73_9ACTN|nr:hypothetical protein [Streptomyces polyasparticus]MBC9716022.1 hypothetical protein [Streptomyces polyasparticus]
MRTYLRAAVVTLAASATLGVCATGALAVGHDHPVAPRTGTVALSDAHGNEVNQVPQDARRTYVKTAHLKGGMTAEVHRLTVEGRFKGHQADLFLGNVHLGTITAVDMPELTLNDGVHVKLTPHGTITSWTDKPSKPGKPASKPDRPSGEPAQKPHKPQRPGKPQPQICPPGPDTESARPDALPGTDTNDTGALSG